jgi:hypothetical protein
MPDAFVACSWSTGTHVGSSKTTGTCELTTETTATGVNVDLTSTSLELTVSLPSLAVGTYNTSDNVHASFAPHTGFEVPYTWYMCAGSGCLSDPPAGSFELTVTDVSADRPIGMLHLVLEGTYAATNSQALIDVALH